MLLRLLAFACLLVPFQTHSQPGVPENLFRGELVAYPGPWSFLLPKAGIIFVRDAELDAMATDPDKLLNLTTDRTPRPQSLRQVCENAQAQGMRTLFLAFDHFFAQYRPGQEAPRHLTPDSDEYIERIAAIGKFAANYGLRLELSLLSPLELGKAYRVRENESGVWMHYREGLRDPKTGAFSVQLWQQQRWANNKGNVDIEDAGVRVFAFHETPVAGTPYRAVEPASIAEVTEDVHVEAMPGIVSGGSQYRAQRVRVWGRGTVPREGLDRVLVVQLYRTPEMDYFSPKALPFMTGLLDRYAAAGVRLNALYADEMHIQQDWSYFSHHDQGEFALRYVSPGLGREYARRYGDEYRDFTRYLVYFAYGQEDFANDLTARQGSMHVFGSSPEEIRRTALFRARYYHLLQDGVVDLFVEAKRYAERKMGYQLEARAHATWAESPTIDSWGADPSGNWHPKYEYTSDFVWSNTVHQAASACYDYFKWGDFLTGNGNDHAEGGWIDRDYYALALAASTGILNEVPLSYAAHWGVPDEIGRRRQALEDTYGDSATPAYGIVQGLQHRDAEVLMLYPLDLVAAEERFGSWMTQYGYANYVTPAKLLERGRMVGNAIEMAGRRFTTLVALFEPFPSDKLLALMKEFAAKGGRVVWSGPPPLLTLEGAPARPAWQELFGVDYEPAADGVPAPGAMVRFEGRLGRVEPQTILTDLLVDRVYPVMPRPGTAVVARVKDWIAGTARGNAVFLGYRPRDDQSRSLGYDVRNWFEVLDALGAYAPSGKFPQNDNTEYVSRTSPFLACHFPNGTVAVAPHLREVEEGWSGGFARDPEEDGKYLERHPAPSDALRLRDLKVNGHSLTYDGALAVAFRVDGSGSLIGFSGRRSHEIIIDGRKTVFADRDTDAAWAPVPPERRVERGAVIQIQVTGPAVVRIPDAGLPAGLELYAEGDRPGGRGARVPCRREDGALVFEVNGAASGRWLYGVAGL